MGEEQDVMENEIMLGMIEGKSYRYVTGLWLTTNAASPVSYPTNWQQ